MKTPSTFATVYTEWLDTFRSMIPGGCIKPEKKPEQAPAPKIPF